MRTTLTLNDDLAVRLETLRAERRVSFKELVDQVLRAGLSALDSPSSLARETRITAPMNLGRRLVSDVDDIADTLAIAEGEGFR